MLLEEVVVVGMRNEIKKKVICCTHIWTGELLSRISFGAACSKENYLVLFWLVQAYLCLESSILMVGSYNGCTAMFVSNRRRSAQNTNS